MVSSVGTLAALLFGLYVYAHDRRERHSEQASMISAWLQFRMYGVEGRIPRVTLFISNRSEQPVYDVTVWSLKVAADGKHLPVLPPATPHDEETARSMMPDGQEYSARLILVFTDARGRKWHRANGKLTRWHWIRRYLFSRHGVPRAVLRLDPPPEGDGE